VTGSRPRRPRRRLKRPGDQFLVGIDSLAPLGGERQGDRDRLHIADDADQQRGDEDRRPQPASNGGRASLAGPAEPRRGADAARGEPKPRRPRGRGDGHRGAHLRQEVRGSFADPDAEQEGLEAAARPQEKDQRGEADRRGIRIDLGEAGHDRLQNIQQIFAFRADATSGPTWPAAIWTAAAVMKPEMTGG